MPDVSIHTAQQFLQDILRPNTFVPHKAVADAIEQVGASIPHSTLGLLRLVGRPRQLIQVLAVSRLVRNLERLRQQHNQAFIQAELQSKANFFDTVGGFPLDEQQRRAVISDEDNTLVIAGAGSGKTLTIVAKVKYLLEYTGVSPAAILPISFTAKSAQSLQERVGIAGIKPQTFHKFGLNVLRTVDGVQPNICSNADSERFFKGIITELSLDHGYLALLNSFLLNHIRVPRSQFEFKTHGEYIQYLKDQNFTTYKRVQIPHAGRVTYKNETVKSIEECVIANFLLFNRVEYDYERQYEFPAKRYGQRQQYKPDFTLHTPAGKVYLEHLGIDRAGNVPKFFAGPRETRAEATKRYERMSEWKRRTHTAQGTRLVESYSYQFSDGSLITALQQNLKSAGVALNPMSEAEIWEVIQESGKDQVDAFIELSKTFLSLLKSNGHTIADVRLASKKSDTNPILKKRARLFLDLFEPIYDSYQDFLREQGQIDFSDMIIRAAEMIADGDYHAKLDYVIVDEFQDLSFGRYRLLQAIKQQNPNVKLYCVGDDWQSIYRFAGSDMALFRDFEDFFGFTHHARIETTYRFNEPLIGTSSAFILKNPNQTHKSLRAPEGFLPSSHSIIESDNFYGDDTEAVIAATHQLVEYGLTPSSSVYIVGRYGFDIKRIANSEKQFVINMSAGTVKYTFSKGEFNGQTISMQFVTAHKSKGLEADYVIMLNCNSGRYGFPTERSDDPILNLLLSSADQFENGEDRRLFYVAMTRAKRHVVLVTDRYRKSKFIKELQTDEANRLQTCPLCRNGEIILRSGTSGGRNWKFYGCTNYAYGCEYTKNFHA